MFIMAAVPNSFSGSPAGSDGASGGSACGNRRKNGRAGNVFGISSRNSSTSSTSTTTITSSTATTTSSGSNSGASFGASLEAAGLLEMDENDNSYPWGLLHHNELAHMITTGLGKTMVIDSRSFLEYNTSNVQQSVNVCCSKLVKRRLQQDKVHVLDLLHQTCNIGADETWDVVVYDQCTEDPSLLTPDNFVQVLLHKLSTTFNSVAFLKGGFLAFHASHPSLTENKSCSHRCSTLTSLSQPCMPVSNVGPTRILPFLYLGSQQDSLNQELAQVNGITYILNVSKTCPCPSYIQENHFYRIPVNDNYCEKLLPYFEEAFQFLDKVREANGCVLVHCLGGVSRSATLTIAYIMKYMRMSPDEAYRYVKDKRPTISPNFNFLGQLIEYEKLLRQEALEMEQRRNSTRTVVSPVSSSGGEDFASPSPAVMDLHSTASPLPLGPKVIAHQAVPSFQEYTGLPLPQVTFPLITGMPSAVTTICKPSTPAFVSHFSLPEANVQSVYSTIQDCPFPGPDNLDSKTVIEAELPFDRQLYTASPVNEVREGEQLLLRQKKAGSSRRSGLRPTSAPTPYTGNFDLQTLPGPLLQHRQLFEAALKQEAKYAWDNNLISGETNSQQPEHIPAQSPVCPVTGFPSPGMCHEDMPQSTCPVITGFPGPHSLDYQTGHSNNLPDTSNSFTIPASEPSDLSTYHINQSDNAAIQTSQNISQDSASLGGIPHSCVDSSTATIQNALKGSQQQQTPNKRFSFSSMFSGFRWRSRPPTLPLSSPVGSMKKHGGESGIVDSRNQLTPVSEAIENSDLNSSEPITSTAKSCEVLSSSHSASSEAIMVADMASEEVKGTNYIGSNSDHFNANSQTSGYSSMSLSLSAPSLSTTSNEDMSKDNTLSKSGSLRSRAKGFTLSLSSPTSNFPVKFSPSSMPSPSDSTNKRKSFLPSSSISPDKLAKTDSPLPHSQSQAAVSTIVPPKTLNLAQSTMGKLKQRLSGRKSMALPISSPTAAMAKLNFASPSAEMAESLPFCQNQEDLAETSSKTCHVYTAGSAMKQSMDIPAEDHKPSRRGKGHKKEGPKSLFSRKSKWSEERSSPRSDNTGAVPKNLDIPVTSSSLIGSFSSSSMSSSSASSKMSLSLSSSTMSSSTFSDMSSSSNISSSPPPFPAPIPLPSSSSCSQASPLAAAAAATSFGLRGLSEFPTTSLDKLSFTPCYTKDIVQELKQRESSRKSSTSGPIPAGDGSSGPSALDSPMSISSGSSAPSVASSTLSPVESNLTNPFTDCPSHYDVMETLAAYPLPQSPPPTANSIDQEEEDESSSCMPRFAGSPGEGASNSADLSLTSPSDFDILSPSSLPQATMAPTFPTTPSSYYCSSSSIEPLSPMSLSDNSSSNSPIRSPTRQLHQQHLLHQQHQHLHHHTQHASWGKETGLAISSSSCISAPIFSSTVGCGIASSSSISSSVTSPLSSLSQLSSASSVASTSKVVLRRHRPKGTDGKSAGRNTGCSGSKHKILDRPNSIAFSHYPACDLVAPTPPSLDLSDDAVANTNTSAPSPASFDDASEVYMSTARRSMRHKHRHQQSSGQDMYTRQGRTSWGVYSEREVYRQITAAMETAMLRTQAYGRRVGPGGRHNSKGHSRKARSLDDILDSSSSDVEFVTGRRVAGRPFSNSSRFTGQKEQYHCGMRSGSEPYHSNSSLSSNGSHGSSLEIIQLPH